MRRLSLLVFALVTACWSEAEFRARCEAAGNCVAPDDAGVMDAGVMDAGVMDAGVMDAGVMDAGVMDAGVMDAGVMDAGGMDAGVMAGGVMDAGVMEGGGMGAGVMDAGVMDAGVMDAGVMDAGVMDAGVMDAGVMDAGVMDAGVMDAGVMDAGVMDAGVMDAGGPRDAGLLPDGGVTWAAVTAELFNTTNADPGIQVLAFPVATPTKSLGGVLTPRGTVVCIPAQGHVLEVFPDGGTRSILFLGDAGTTNDLWQGGVLQPDGQVLGFPHSVNPNVPVVISETALTPLAAELPGSTPLTEGGVITTAGDVIMMPVGYPAFSVLSANVLSSVPVDAGIAPTWSDAFFSSAVLRASGMTAIAVPRIATAVWEVSTTSATPIAPLTGYAGGLLLPNEAALLMPIDGNRAPAIIFQSNSISSTGPITHGYFSAAWSTNGFGYAIQTVNAAGSYLTITKTGGVTESPLPSNARLPDGGAVATNSVLSNTSRFGLVAFPDGQLVSCPYADARLVFIVPNGRRTVPSWVVLSPWLNKW